MYTKEQASAIRQEFWRTFGQYMALHHSSEGQRINWINYKTGIRHLAFKMDADNKQAAIEIEMNHPDAGIQELMFEQFLELKPILHDSLQEEWNWELHTTDKYQRTVSSIGTVLPGVSIFKQEDWPALISFFKPRIIALDEFWSFAQYRFDIFK